MECKKCACRDMRVVWVRPRGDSIVRLRRCRNCGWEKRTTETAATENLEENQVELHGCNTVVA